MVERLEHGGEFAVRQMDAGKIAAPLLAGGTLQGKGVYSMKGLLPERMILNAQLDGNFAIQKGRSPTST